MPRNDPDVWTSPAWYGLARARVVDDRGHRLPLVTAAQARGRGMDEAASDAIRGAAWRGIPATGWFRFAFMVVLEGFIVYLAAWGIWRARTSPYARPLDWLHPTMMIVCAVVVVATTWLGMKVQHAASLAAAYVRAGVCGSCGYALAGLKRAEDGCVVCPECGGAWRVQDPGA